MSGVSQSHMTLIWCLSPLVGFFLTPIAATSVFAAAAQTDASYTLLEMQGGGGAPPAANGASSAAPHRAVGGGGTSVSGESTDTVGVHTADANGANGASGGDGVSFWDSIAADAEISATFNVRGW